VKALLVTGSLLVLAAVAEWLLLGVPLLTLVLALLGLGLLLVAVFRRYGRPGDFRRSGGPWT
jgi:hypothetical protein